MIDHFGLWFDQPIVICDLETTGRDSTRSDRIVEIAAVRVDRFKIVDRWHSYVNPERPIPDEASRVHGLYDEDVARAPTFEQLSSKFIDFCDGSVPCAYNEGFDRGFVMAELWNAGVPLDIPLLRWPRWLDPLPWVRSIDRFVVDGGGEKVSNSLAAACARRAIETPSAHNALADATATATLLATLSSDMPRCTLSELLRRQPLLAAAYDRRKQGRG